MKQLIFDKYFAPFISHQEISERVSEIAGSINKDYIDRQPLFIAILNGSFVFAADLFKQITIPAEISFVKLSSYNGTSSTGSVTTAIGLENNLSNKDVIIIEDIIDTGKTLHDFLAELNKHEPASVKICTLLHKKACTTYPIRIDYVGFEIPERFVVGYGLDYNGFGRNINGLLQLAE
ncbi:MAG: hypoxanthine phosphoribosyltransferase [bacterium]|jgi:hypoxanthine phosphoribosyltransferase